MYKVGRSRTPQGVRGLKLDITFDNVRDTTVALRKECVD